MSAAKPSRPAADERIPVVCCDCHRQFMALGEWQRRRRSCDHAGKAGREAPAPASEATRWRLEKRP